ncbi:MAG: ATP-binding protein [Prevotellaceae bacterium]|jgi:AAA+ ATPase superfamily predicted ATPase|nr:ATP-binding protein [Prevotellaceae bacterium]
MKDLEEEKSPFMFGKTVQKMDFINRTKDIEHLWLNLRSGINSVLISPRRWGKSSLVEHTATVKNNENNVRWCFIDMFAVRNENNFYEQLCTELLKVTSSKWQNWVENVKTFFQQIVPHINIGQEPTTDFSLSFKWEELKKNREEIINLPEKIAQKFDIQLIVCIDEFQNIHTFEEADAFEKLLRSQWQHHKKVSYCLYGSKRTLMTDIFNQKNRAFYRFGDIIMLDKIATEHWTPFIVERFAQTGKEISEELAEKIAVLMKNHPYYVQQLSHYVWEFTRTQATHATLQQAIMRMLEVNTALYQYEIEHLSNTQVELLKAIVNNEKQFTAQETLQNYRIGTPQNVLKNLKMLEKMDFIEKHKQKTELLDPALELWFRHFYMNFKFNI